MKKEEFNHLGIVVQPYVGLFTMAHESASYEQSCITPFTAIISYVDENGATDEIGQVRGKFLNLPKMETEGVTCLCGLIEVAKEKFLYKGLISKELHDVYESFENKNPEYFIYSGILVIDHINISEEYRGNKISLSVVHQIIDKMNFGASIVAINVKEEKLKDYFSLIDFKRIGKTDTLVLSTTLTRPFIWDVLNFSIENWKKEKKKHEHEYVEKQLFEKAAIVRDEIKTGRRISVI